MNSGDDATPTAVRHELGYASPSVERRIIKWRLIVVLFVIVCVVTPIGGLAQREINQRWPTRYRVKGVYTTPGATSEEIRAQPAFITSDAFLGPVAASTAHSSRTWPR